MKMRAMRRLHMAVLKAKRQRVKVRWHPALGALMTMKRLKIG